MNAGPKTEGGAVSENLEIFEDKQAVYTFSHTGSGDCRHCRICTVDCSQRSHEAVMSHSLQAPGGEYLCGTDKLGRDVLSRVIYGTRSSLVMTLCLVAVIFVVGTALGILAGYFGGFVDAVIMRIADMMISFPGLVLAIAIAGLLGPSMVNAVLAIRQ